MPIKDGYDFCDLAKELNAKVLVVVGSRLGVLNHSALSFEVLKNQGLEIIGYVFNELTPMESDDASLDTNREEVKKIAEKFSIKEIGYQAHLSKIDFKL